MSIINLLAETMHSIEASGHAITEVAFVGSSSTAHCCSWECFVDIGDVQYDDGFGCAEVASDLIVVFTDGSQLQRWEYDGSEGWEYIAIPKLPASPLAMNCVAGGLSPYLAELNPKLSELQGIGYEQPE